MSSTTCAIIDIHNDLTERLEEKDTEGVILISFDMSKAFDKLPHFQLIQELINLNLPSGFIMWTQNYLTDRYQRTILNHHTSDTVLIPSGVPQGACLSPYLFAIYVSTLKPKFPKTRMTKYADDFTIAISYNNNMDMTECHEEILNISEWCTSHSLTLNLGKTKMLCISFKYNICPTIENINRVSDLCILGITFNEKLRWDCHIDNILRSASKRIHALRVLKGVLPKKELTLVYTSNIRSLLEYGCQAFVGLNATLSAKLEILQNRCHKIICEPGCTCHRFPPLQDRRKQLSVKLFNTAATVENHILHPSVPQRLPVTGKFRLPTIRTTRRLNSFIPFTAMLINDTNI